MDKPILSNPDVYPTEEVISFSLGRTMAAYKSMMEFNHTHHPDFVERWKYYNDGKSWLFNVSRKKKTLFWLSILKGSFRTTFYMGPKAEDSIVRSSIPEDLKRQYLSGAERKIRGITLIIKTKKDLDTYRELLDLKLANL